MNVSIAMASEMIEALMDENIPPFVWGAPGIGKSQTVAAIATKRKWGLIDFRAILRDPVDLRGLPTIDLERRRAVWLCPDDLPDEKRDGKHGILFMDELNTAPTSVMNACLGLALEGRIGQYTLPKGWRIAAAGNRQADRAAVNKMPSALASRFAHIDVEPDVDAFIDWCLQNDVDEIIPAFIRFRPALLHSMEGTDLRAFPNPRNWVRVSKVVRKPTVIRTRLVAAIVGDGPSGEFESFVKVCNSLPEYADIVAKPNKTVVPEEPSGKYAVAGMLAHRTTRKDFDAVSKYAMRLGREFEIVTILDATKRNPGLTETEAFRDFVMRNKGVTLPKNI